MTTASWGRRLFGSSLLALVLACLWVLFTSDASPWNLLVALVYGFTIAVWITPVPRQEVRINWLYLLPFGAWVCWELLKSSASVAIEVVRPSPRRRPAIVDVPLDATCDSQLALLSHVITLTPGTMVMGLSQDRRSLRLHGMFVDDPQGFVDDIKGDFERRVLELLPCR